MSGASPLFNTGNAQGTLTLGTTAAVTQEQRFRLTNSVATGGVELVLNGAGTSWGLYDRTASKWAIQITRGATDAVSIPGSLAVTDALSTSSTFSASSYAAVGGAVSANSQLYVRGTMVGTGTNQYAALVQTTFPVAATSSMQGLYVQSTGAAGTYTTTDVVGVNVQAFALGAGQTVTNSYGMFIGASSHAATTKYGIQINNVTGGTTNYALYTGTGQVRFGDDIRIVNGSLSLTTVPSKTQVAIQVNTDHTLLTSSTSYGMIMQPTAQGTVTNFRVIEARVAISATTALAAAFGAYIRTPTIAAGGTITTNYGLHIEGQTGATTNYAIYTNAGLVRFGDAVQFPGISTTANAANAFLDSGASNNLLRSTSSVRYKRDIETLETQYADNVLALRPVWYRSKAPRDNQAWGWYGLIAEEAAAVDPRIVHWGYTDEDYEEVIIEQAVAQEGELEVAPRTERRLKDGAELKPDGVQYERLSVLLLDVVKRQMARIEALEARLEALEA